MVVEEPLVRIVDDDDSLRNSLSFLLTCEGYVTELYPDAASFLVNDQPSRPGCLILDVRMSEMSGLALQRELNRRAVTLPIIFLTAHGDIDMAVQSMRDGAFDFLQKPVDPPRLITAVARAVKKSCGHETIGYPPQEALSRYQLLTSRESQVMRLVAKGLLNRQIAARLGLSVRTVETQRASAKKKLPLLSVSDLAPFFETVDALLLHGTIDPLA